MFYFLILKNPRRGEGIKLVPDAWEKSKNKGELGQLYGADGIGTTENIVKKKSDPSYLVPAKQGQLLKYHKGDQVFVCLSVFV